GRRNAVQLRRQQAVDLRSGPALSGIRRTAATFCAVLCLLAPAATAAAQGPPAAGSTSPASTGSAGATAGARQTATGAAAAKITRSRAIRIARREPKVAEQRARYGPLSPSAQAK